MPKLDLTKPLGRPSKKDPEKVEELLKMVRVAVPMEVACQKIGVSTVTIWRWEKSDPVFAERLAEAKSDGQLGLFYPLRKAAESSATVSMWLLEKLYPKQYGQQQYRKMISQEDVEKILWIIEETCDASLSAEIFQRIADEVSGAQDQETEADRSHTTPNIAR